MRLQRLSKTLGHGSLKIHLVGLEAVDRGVGAGVVILPLPQQERKREARNSIQSAEPRDEGRFVGGCDSEFYCGCGCDGGSIFLPDRHPVGVGVLGKIVHLPSSLGTVSYNGEVMLSAENGMVANAPYNHTL